MKKIAALAAVCAAASLLISPLQAGAGGMLRITRPHLEYTVLRDQETVGLHVIDFTRSGDTTNVKISTNVVVTVAFIPVYRFEHAGLETWQGSRLVSIRTRTNDDGTPHQLSATAEGDHLRVAGDASQGNVGGAIIPASLWNAAIVNQSSILNTLDGREMPISVVDQGNEIVSAAGAEVSAHHFTVSGGIDRELWFDRSNTLVRVAFAAKDGSHIFYQLR
jgi:hypothetical protein